MVGDASSSRAVFGQNEQASDRPDGPSTCSGQVGCQTDLPVQGREHAAHIRHHALDLDDQERARRCVEPKDVDRTALAVDAECHLGRDIPAISAKLRDHGLHERGMAAVSKAIEPFSLIQDPHLQISAER